MINNWQLTNTDRQTTAMTMTITEEDLNETVLQGKMSEKLCIKWNEFQHNISKIFGKLRADTDYTDVTLACEDGKQIGAHRVVLAASSDFFQKLFARTKHSHPMIYLRGMKSEDLAPIIDFVYFGEAKIYQENLDNFLSVANEFQIKGLMNQFGDVVREFETEKELPFKPVADSDNSQWIEETEQSQKYSKTGMEVVAVLSPLSCDIESQVKSMMKKSKNCVKKNSRGGRKQKAHICKVCGKEGDASSIKYHIERSHLDNFSVLCDQCEKSYKTRVDLKRHKQTHS